ncbi:DUF6265 family protein [Maribacter stanieri]|uniref:DUF6265 domain-containing protein n=1 Tax=Maribacter stanieri TaxID=440514 RepID=A0A1I6I3G0_9FLAO|nr:DUF6265 family protein [Maribacter stanieri]SFR61265.1 hypothetical protein SAMN04488010_1069 [Maribacter stanieri]|tara:strand:- start:402 stop:896 length:495 start_codon:yes stop_codon:yes gene_type:complete
MKLLLLFFLSTTCLLQSQNTISFEEGMMMSPAATLNDIEWLAGHWKGEAFGGIAEEIWSPPLDGSMMFSFRLLDKGEVSFYEFGHLIEIDATLILQLKHFDANLSGWEERDENIDFKLVKVEENRFYFDDFTIEYISDKEINMYVEVGDENGTSNEVKFNYHRQ